MVICVDYDKTLFLMKLIKDSDFFVSEIVDFEVNDKNESVLIVRDKDYYRNMLIILNILFLLMVIELVL